MQKVLYSPSVLRPNQSRLPYLDCELHFLALDTQGLGELFEPSNVFGIRSKTLCCCPYVFHTEKVKFNYITSTIFPPSFSSFPIQLVVTPQRLAWKKMMFRRPQIPQESTLLPVFPYMSRSNGKSRSERVSRSKKHTQQQQNVQEEGSSRSSRHSSKSNAV